MIKFTGMSSEHTNLPTYISKLSRDRYCTYAWIVTDEINSEDEFAVTVMDYKPKRSKQTKFVFTEQVWGFIERERTEEQQNFIDKNIDRLNELFIDFAQSIGYLEEV